MARFSYRRIDTSNLPGLRSAERLKARGWKIIQSGLFSVLMESPPIQSVLEARKRAGRVIARRLH